MKPVLDYLSKTYWPLTAGARFFIVEKSEEITLKKRAILLKPGDTCRDIWFIKKGLLRAHQLNAKGKECSNWFMRENDTATSVLSFFLDQPTDEGIEAMEDTVLYRMSRKDLFDGIKKYKSLSTLTLMIIIKYYCQSRLMESNLRRKEPEQIHQYLLQQHTELVQRVQEKHLATFLGVTDPTYNAIKNGKRTGSRTSGRTRKPK